MRFVREQFYLAAAVQNLKRLVRFLTLKPQPANCCDLRASKDGRPESEKTRGAKTTCSHGLFQQLQAISHPILSVRIADEWAILHQLCDFTEPLHRYY